MKGSGSFTMVVDGKPHDVVFDGTADFMFNYRVPELDVGWSIGIGVAKSRWPSRKDDKKSPFVDSTALRNAAMVELSHIIRAVERGKLPTKEQRRRKRQIERGALPF